MIQGFEFDRPEEFGPFHGVSFFEGLCVVRISQSLSLVKFPILICIVRLIDAIVPRVQTLVSLEVGNVGSSRTPVGREGVGRAEIVCILLEGVGARAADGWPGIQEGLAGEGRVVAVHRRREFAVVGIPRIAVGIE